MLKRADGFMNWKHYFVLWKNCIEIKIKIAEFELLIHFNFNLKYAMSIPRSAWRFQMKRFKKTQCPMVERFKCSLMMHGRSHEIKIKANNIIRHIFELISLMTGRPNSRWPLQSEFKKRDNLKWCPQPAHGPQIGDEISRMEQRNNLCYLIFSHTYQIRCQTHFRN